MNAEAVALRSRVILARIHEPVRVGEADAVTRGIYGSVSSGSVYAYPDPDRSNGLPLCNLPVSGNIAVDRQGDLLVVTERSTPNVIVYAGPGLCGPELGSISDPYGFPVDVASRDARNGRIVMATSGSPFKHDSVSVCTLSGGCTANLKTPGMKYVLGVALAPNGDCWASGGSQMSGRIVGSLGYFAHCRGRGVAATGFLDGDPNGLDIDASGNLVSVSDDSLYVYSGCNPACTLLGGPFRLHGVARYGHLDASSKHFVAADVVCGSGNVAELDVYSYSTSAIKHEYSISNGISSSCPTDAAFSPSSKE